MLNFDAFAVNEKRRARLDRIRSIRLAISDGTTALPRGPQLNEVLEDGAPAVPRAKFRKILATYAPKNVLSIEADPAGLRIGGFSMKARRYEPTAVSPGDFQRFILTDRSWMGR